MFNTGVDAVFWVTGGVGQGRSFLLGGRLGGRVLVFVCGVNVRWVYVFTGCVDEVLTVSCNGGHANITIASILRVVTGKLAAIPARRLLSFVLGCIRGRPIRHVVIKRPGRVGGRRSRGVHGVIPFIGRLEGGLPSVPMRFISRQFASMLTRRTVLSKNLGGGSERGGTLISRVDTAVVLRSCLRSGGCVWWVGASWRG